MIVVIGNLIGRVDEAGEVQPAGFVATLATSAAKAGSSVQVVAKIGDDPAGDAVLLGLAAAGVGHVATLRDAGRSTPVSGETDGEDPAGHTASTSFAGDPMLEAADVSLALRYLTDYRVIVVAHAFAAAVLAEAASAATWAAAHLVVVSADEAIDTSIPHDALVISADLDADGLATRLGLYAATVDAGERPDTAYAVLTEATIDS